MTPPGKWPWITLLGLMVAVAVAMLLSLSLARGEAELPGAAWLALAIVPALGLGLGSCMRRRSVVLHDGVLIVRAALYTQSIPLGDIDVAHIRIVDLASHSELMPGLKTNGFGLPGFWAGHFRSRRWTKQFLLLTDRSRVLVLPQRSGRTVLLSLEHPHALMKALQAARD